MINAHILLGLVLSLGITLAATMLPAILVGRRQINLGWIAPLAIGVSYAVAFGLIASSPVAAPGKNVNDWLYYNAIAVACIGFFATLLSAPVWVNAVLGVLLIRICGRLILGRQIGHALAVQDTGFYLDVAGLAALVWIGTLHSLAHRLPSWLVTVILGLLTMASAATILTNAIMSNFYVAGSVGFALLGLFIATLISPKKSLAAGAVFPVSLILLLMLLHGYFYGADPTPMSQWGLAILLLSPLGIFAGDLPLIRNFKPAWIHVVRMAVVAALLTTALAKPVRAYVREAAKEATAEMEN